MAVPVTYWFLFCHLLCFCARDVTCLCNVTCVTDYSQYLECTCAEAPPRSVGLKAICRGEDDGEPMDVLSSCELRPPETSCQMLPQNFSKITSTDTLCTVTVADPLGAPTADPLGGAPVEPDEWLLADRVRTLAPSGLRATRLTWGVNLTWEVDNYLHICLTYRVRITDPTQARTFEEPQQSLVIEAPSLAPGRRSLAAVQAAPCPDGNFLQGPWSGWSPSVDLGDGGAEEQVPPGGRSQLVLWVTVPALLCLIALCYVSKPFCMKKVQILMFIPDPSPFFKSFHENYDGNFKAWVRPAFSEAEVLRVVPTAAPVPAGEQKLLLLRSHHGDQATDHHIQRGEEEEGEGEGEEEEEEEKEDGCGGCNNQECRRGGRIGPLSLHTVVLSGCEGDEGPADGGVRGRGGAGRGDGGAGPQAQSVEESGGPPGEGATPGRGPWREVPPPAPLPPPGPPDPWGDDYPRLDLDTVDSGFGGSACSSPLLSEGGGGGAEAGFFAPDDGVKSNYVRQWMMNQQPSPPPTE